jgi:hypothetical protein
MIVLPALPDAFWARMHTIETYEEDESATGRLHFWQVAIQMANANLLGIGHNAYNTAYDTYDFSHGKYGRGRSVHSSFFGILAEAGYIGFALYTAILVGAFRSCHRVQKQAVTQDIPVELVHGAAALEASLAAFVVGGSFVPFQYNEMLWHFIGITIVLQQLADQHRIAPKLGSLPARRTLRRLAVPPSPVTTMTGRALAPGGGNGCPRDRDNPVPSITKKRALRAKESQLLEPTNPHHIGSWR